MQKIRRDIIVGHTLLLAAGGLLGWLYDHIAWGLLAAAMLGLGWNIRQLLVFEQALRDKEFGSLRYGDSIWSQLYSRFSYLRSQSKEYKKNYRRLVKEVRKSTNAMPSSDGGVESLPPGKGRVVCASTSTSLPLATTTFGASSVSGNMVPIQVHPFPPKPNGWSAKIVDVSAGDGR